MVIDCQGLVGINSRWHLHRSARLAVILAGQSPPYAADMHSSSATSRVLHRAVKYPSVSGSIIGMCQHLLPNLGERGWWLSIEPSKRFVVVFSTRHPLVLASHCAQSRCSATDTPSAVSLISACQRSARVEKRFMSNRASSKPLSACIGIRQINIGQDNPISTARLFNGLEPPLALRIATWLVAVTTARSTCLPF